MTTIPGKINLFQSPHLLGATKEIVANLQTQIDLVEGFNSAKELIQAHKPIYSNTLNRCARFAASLEAPASNEFATEVSMLTLDELMFISICFTKWTERFTKSIKAYHVRTYMRSQNMGPVDRHEIHRRLKYLVKKNLPEHSRFIAIYRESDPGPSPLAPMSGSNTAEDDWRYEISSWPSVSSFFAKPVLENIPEPTGHLCLDVRTAVPRFYGDPTITLNPHEAPWLNTLFSPFGMQARVSQIANYLGPLVLKEIENSELRKWEKRQGMTEYTDCVRIVPALEIQVGRREPLITSLYPNLPPPPPNNLG